MRTIPAFFHSCLLLAAGASLSASGCGAAPDSPGGAAVIPGDTELIPDPAPADDAVPQPIESSDARDPVGTADADGRVLSPDGMQGKAAIHTWRADSNKATWPTGFFTLNMDPVASHVCAMSGVIGQYQGNYASSTYMYSSGGGGPYTRTSPGYWSIAGSRSDSNLHFAMESICYPRSMFHSGAVTDTWVSDPVSAQGIGEFSKPLWLGDAGSFLAGISGRLEGTGENIEVRQSSSASQYSSLYVKSAQDTAGGSAMSFFVGRPGSGKVAKFIGPGGIGSAALAGEYSLSVGKGFKEKVMAHYSLAMCYLTRVSGDFQAWADYVRITVPVDGYWRLQVEGVTANPGVYAWARCMMLDQT